MTHDKCTRSNPSQRIAFGTGQAMSNLLSIRFELSIAAGGEALSVETDAQRRRRD